MSNMNVRKLAREKGIANSGIYSRVNLGSAIATSDTKTRLDMEAANRRFVAALLIELKAMERRASC